jgi:hypothetical protein
LLRQYLKAGFHQGLTGIQEEIDQALIAFVENEKSAQAAKQTRQVEEESGAVDWDGFLHIVKLSELRDRAGLVFGSRPEDEARLADLHGPTTALFRDLLSQATGLARKGGGTLVFIYLPSWSRYANRIDAEGQKRDEVLAIARELKIPVVDVHRLFESHADPLSLFPFQSPGHYNEEGNRLVAQEVLAEVERIFAEARRAALRD